MDLRIELAGADVYVRGGSVGETPIGDAAVIQGVLVAVGPKAASCALCGAERAQERLQRLLLLPLCRHHALEGHFVSIEELKSRVEGMRQGGTSPDVIAAWANFAVKRLEPFAGGTEADSGGTHARRIR